ncbi:hypothetical protein OC861_004779 [Tilletia horrida]|nr:hypothetical protein OC861_004779 [Tilletia horrida]
MTSIGRYRIAPQGLGLMRLTSIPAAHRISDEEAFEVIKTGIDAASPDRLLLNTGTFYGSPDDSLYANLQLLRRFFGKYPELKDRVVVNVKGGIVIPELAAKGWAGMRPSAKVEDLREDLVALRRELGSDDGGVSVHVFEMARRDLTTDVEQTIRNLNQLRKEGLFEYIALSEVGADTIKRAVRTAKEEETEIVSVEVEYSPFFLDIASNGVLNTCRELCVPITVYSPCGKGFLGGQLKSRADLPASDPRLGQEQFSEDNFPKNVKLAETFAQLAASRSPPVSSAQLALAWISSQSTDGCALVPIPGTTKAERVKENMAATEIKLSEDEVEKLNSIFTSLDVAGHRYPAFMRNNGSLFA